MQKYLSTTLMMQALQVPVTIIAWLAEAATYDLI